MIKNKDNIYVFHPGEILKDFLSARNLKQKEFAERCGITEKHLSEILNAKVPLSIDIAMKFGAVLHENYKTWLNMQNEYDIAMEDKKINSELANPVVENIVNLFPIKDMMDLGLISGETFVEKARSLLSFFKIAKIDNLINLSNKYYAVKYRKIGNNYSEPNKKQVADAVLCRWGEIIVEKKEVKNKFTKEKFLEAIRKIRNNATIDFYEWIKFAQTECEKAGVIFIITNKIKNANASGISYLINKIPVIHLTIRQKCVDTIMFSFFHEAYHILNILKNKDIKIEELENEENEANNYSKNILIPSKEWNNFSSAYRWTKDTMISFANKMNLPVDCILGRLQKEGFIDYNKFTNLKQEIDFSKIIER